ncbi:MAG: hypothetical protein IJT44_13210 [Clostridia bacterium]|nr:hypothetical protein [Clostridia bacterium]
MKTKSKIILIICIVLAVAAVAIGVLYGIYARKTTTPELQEEKLYINPINYSTVYVVGQPPYTDKTVFDTKIGIEYYWLLNHTGGNGMEILLQCSKDGHLVVMSEPLPALSNAQDLYGKDVKVSDLTLDELKKINMAYNFRDKDGVQIYVNYTDSMLDNVSVLTLDELLDYFKAPNRITVKLFLRFLDESQIPDIQKAVTDLYEAIESRSMQENVIFCPQSSKTAAAADAACPDLPRAATNDEAKALYRDSKSASTNDALPYTTIYEKTDAQFASESFIHYARNLGLAVVLTDVPASDVLQLRQYGVTAVGTNEIREAIQLINDADEAEQ